MSSLRRLIALVAFMAAGAFTPALAASPCPQFFVGGVEPKVDTPRPLQRELCHPSYAILHDGGWREPVWVAEHLTAAEIQAAAQIKRSGVFHVELGLPADERSTNADYDGSGYDKGHQRPADDATDKPDTFTLANMTPQRPNLNRKAWYRGPETITRALAVQDGEVWVVTGPQIGPSPALLNGRVAVPIASWKAVWDAKRGAWAWVCPDTDAPVCVVISLDALHALVGVDPFPSLPTSVKAIAVAPPAS